MKHLPLSGKHGKGLTAIIDDDDYILVSSLNWLVLKTGYVSNSKTRKLLHNYIIQNDYKETKLVVDHINRNKLDNRKENLRLVSQSINCFNSPNRIKTSKYRGVYHYSNKGSVRNKPWVAQINVNKRRITIGYFSTEEEAARAYNEKATEEYGALANINKI